MSLLDRLAGRSSGQPVSVPSANSVRLGDLAVEPAKKPVYRRGTGELFLKLNGEFHVRVKLQETEDGVTWVGDGTAEAVDPDEEVELILP